MFVRKDKNGNLVGVGSVDHGQLAQLRGKAKRDSAKAKAEPKDSEPTVELTPVDLTPAIDEKKPEPEPKPEPVTDKPKGTKSSPTASKLP